MMQQKKKTTRLEQSSSCSFSRYSRSTRSILFSYPHLSVLHHHIIINNNNTTQTNNRHLYHYLEPKTSRRYERACPPRSSIPSFTRTSYLPRNIISPLEIRRTLNTSPKKWVLASSSSSRTIPPPILPDSTNSTYEIFIDIHFEPVSMSEKHTVKLFVSYVFVQVLRTESTHSNTQIRYSSMAESLRDYPFANAMTYVVLRVGLVS